jgi:hypothetical protein
VLPTVTLDGGDESALTATRVSSDALADELPPGRGGAEVSEFVADDGVRGLDNWATGDQDISTPGRALVEAITGSL